MAPSLNPEHFALWASTRSGARAGRGFRYQDAASAWLAVLAWAGTEAWSVVVPEGLDDVGLQGEGKDLRAQLKSRHDPQATFSLSEVADHLAKIALNLGHGDQHVSLALLLERPAEGLAATGWSKPLGASDQDLGPLIALLAPRLPAGLKAEELVARIYVIVEPTPLERLIETICSRTSLSPAAARLLAHRLRHRAGEAADANYSADLSEARTLDASDVQREIDGLHAVLDPLGYAELTGGLCDLAEFDAPIEAASFYSGVDVQPAHVGAGLVFDRPEATSMVLEALEAKRCVLVAGPSGAGKSAIAWMSAFATRHVVRWYRVRQLPVAEVGRLVQFARALEASPTRPVGFVVDDVGRDATAGWDSLVAEIGASPGLLAVGTVREEDVLTLETGGKTRVVRPQLDEDLARRIFLALSKEGETAFQHWPEPYQLSGGLLLEYTHLLTAGQRMAETLGEQVRRRLVEERGDELEILEVVALLSTHGGAADPARLRAVLGLSEVKFAKALARLVDEHALRVRADGSVQGLHEIRSRHLDAALRDRLARPIDELCARALSAARATDFPTLLPRLLRAWPELEDPLLDALAERARGADVPSMVAILRGLGLATVDRIAACWVEITRDCEVDDRFAAIAMSFELADADLDLPMFRKIKAAVDRFRTHTFDDLRVKLQARAPAAFAREGLDLGDAHRLVAASLPLRACPSGPAAGYLPLLDATAPLEPLLAFLMSTHHVSPDVGRGAVAQVGGVDHLLERIWRETDWVTRPVRREFEGEPAVESNIRVADDLQQTDLHGDAVAHCTRLAAADPEAERLLCAVVTSDGRPAGFGDHDIATKQMTRFYATLDPERVAWNRAHGRAIERIIGAETETGRETAIAAAINELETKLREAGDFYCRMEEAPPKWRLFMQVRALLTSFVKPPSVQDVAPEGLGGGFTKDPLHDLVSGLQTLAALLVEPLDNPLLAAGQSFELQRLVETLENPRAWRWTAEPPLAALASLRQHLSDLTAVLEDAHVDAGRRRSSALRLQKSSRKYSVLHRAAEEARVRATVDHQAMQDAIRAACEARGWQIRTVARTLSEPKHVWPGVEFGVFVSVASLTDWLERVPQFRTVVEAPGPYVRMTFVMVRADHAFPMACDWRGNLFPTADPVKEWGDHSPVPFLQDEMVANFVRILESIIRLSAMTVDRDRELNESEAAIVERTTSDLVAAFNPLRELAETTQDADVLECVGIVADLVERLEAETQAAPVDTPNLAAELQAISRDEISELSLLLLFARVNLMERALRNRQVEPTTS